MHRTLRVEEWFTLFKERYEGNEKLEVQNEHVYKQRVANLIHSMAEEMEIDCICGVGAGNEDESERLLDVEFTWLLNYDAYHLPMAVIEHVNSSDFDSLHDAYWKVACVRAPLRVVIGYMPTDGEREDYIADLNRLLQLNHIPQDGSDELIILGLWDDWHLGGWARTGKVNEFLPIEAWLAFEKDFRGVEEAL
jgi:hypothetical protein